MELELKNLKVGDKVWICDFRYNDINNKPIRHIVPTFVQVEDNENLPQNKTVYYSDVHFRPLNNKGAILKKIIAPFDNTGYRSYAGICLNIFDSEAECIEKYNEQCREILAKIEVSRQKVINRLDKMEKEIISNIITELTTKEAKQ